MQATPTLPPDASPAHDVPAPNVAWLFALALVGLAFTAGARRRNALN